MIISESNVTTASQSSYQKSSTQSIKLAAISQDNNGITFTKSFQSNTLRNESYDQFIFTESKNLDADSKQTDSLNPETGKSGLINSTQDISGNIPSSAQELKEMLLQRMIEALTGKKTEVKSLNVMKNTASNLNGISAFRLQPVSQFTGVSLVRETVETEAENVSYQATGEVRTADGKTINIDIAMSMSRSTASYVQESFGIIAPMQNQRMVDPLIINYGGTAASLTDEKYEFDLTCDGKKENISFAGEGSGFLALDKNGDGKINNGSELFGPQTGNGFDELKKYDQDGNGWIDEADDIYNQLKIWSKDKDGNDVLYSLKELDVGAIYLNESKTDYGMYDSSGNVQGAMRSTSFYLKENGGAGFVSHFDLLV